MVVVGQRMGRLGGAVGFRTQSSAGRLGGGVGEPRMTRAPGEEGTGAVTGVGPPRGESSESEADPASRPGENLEWEESSTLKSESTSKESEGGETRPSGGSGRAPRAWAMGAGISEARAARAGRGQRAGATQEEKVAWWMMLLDEFSLLREEDWRSKVSKFYVENFADRRMTRKVYIWSCWLEFEAAVFWKER